MMSPVLEKDLPITQHPDFVLTNISVANVTDYALCVVGMARMKWSIFGKWVPILLGVRIATIQLLAPARTPETTWIIMISAIGDKSIIPIIKNRRNGAKRGSVRSKINLRMGFL